MNIEELQSEITSLKAEIRDIKSSVAIVYPFSPADIREFELNNENDLQRVENYLEKVLELVNESVVVLSEDMNVVRFNEASKALIGTEVLAGDSLALFIHPDYLDVFQDAFCNACADCSGTPVMVEYRARSIEITHIVTSAPQNENALKQNDINGSTVLATPPLMHLAISDLNSFVWMRSTLCKIERRSQYDCFEINVYMVTRSIDEKREPNEHQDKLKATEEAVRINAAKLRYISCISHELKTPVTSFCLTLDLLQQTVLSAEQQELVQQATVAIDMMKLQICQTIDVNKALTGSKLQPSRTTVDLSKLLKRVNVIINGFGKQVPVSYEIAVDLHNSILTDEEWLWQMLLNLLTNACKYTDRGSIRVVVSLFCADPAAAPMLQFEVTDTGVGVSAANLILMFDAFAEVKEGQTTGTGLGLYGVRARAEGLQGTCGARHNLASCTGTGTVVWFSIPYVPDISIKCPTFCFPPPSLDSQPQFLHSTMVPQKAVGKTTKQMINCSMKLNTEQLINNHKLNAEELISSRKLAAEELIKINKLAAEELIRTYMFAAEELINSEKLIAEEQISISKIAAKELISSNKFAAEELINSDKLTADELINSDKLTADEQISINKLAAKDLVSSNKLAAEELISRGYLAAEKQISINKLTANELISVNTIIAEGLNASYKLTTEELTNNNKLIAEGLNSSNKVTAEELISCYKLTVEKLISYGKLAAEEQISINTHTAKELININMLIDEKLSSNNKVSAEELLRSNQLIAEGLNCNNKLTAEELIISYKQIALQEMNINQLTAEELISNNKLTADMLISSDKLTSELQFTMNKLVAEKLVSNKLTAEELISSYKLIAENLISSGKDNTVAQISINNLTAEALNSSNMLAAEGLTFSYEQAAERLMSSNKLTAEEEVNINKLIAEELVNSNELTAENLVINNKVIAEELISSDKFTAEELINFQKRTAKTLSRNRKLAAEELINSDMLTAEKLVRSGKLTAEGQININKLNAEVLNHKRKLIAEELIRRQKLTAAALICSDKLTAEKLAHAEKLTAAELIRCRGFTAMVVEDTFTVRKLMQKLLLSMGFERVDCYEDGSKGLEAMLAASVDIVFSDIQMPIMGGSEMIKRFRQYESEAVTCGLNASGSRQLVIAVTANPSEFEKCGNEGFDKICSKPLHMNDIYRIVDEYFN